MLVCCYDIFSVARLKVLELFLKNKRLKKLKARIKTFRWSPLKYYPLLPNVF